LFYRAIALDHGMAAWCYVIRKNFGWMTDRLQETTELERLANKAVVLGKEDAVALYTGGFALAHVAGSTRSRCCPDRSGSGT
jgi:hypothetical protein